MKHLVLLGDSVFDNAYYVSAGFDVHNQLQRRLASAWQISLLAKDGSTMSDIANQLNKLPKDATHLILSVGGNDAILQMGLLDTPIKSVIEAVGLMTNVSADFKHRYETLIQSLLKYELPLILCTIYSPPLSDANLRHAAKGALALYNDCILRTAIQNRLPVLDMRLVCTDAEDFSHEIEPSEAGGTKIAAAIERYLTDPEKAPMYTQVFF